MLTTTKPITLDTDGLTDACRPELVRFGRRDTGAVMNVPELEVAEDDGGLSYFGLTNVFTQPTTLIGFGTPNTYLVVPSECGTSTRKLAAFMFWRSESAVLPTKGRVQAGVLFELRDLSAEANKRLAESLEDAKGKRSASCAHLVALTLANAGFRFGNGRSLTRVYRPSKFASLLWRRGLLYVDKSGETHAVKLRIVHAGPVGFGSHFTNVWKKEVTSPARTVRKQYAKNLPHTPAPLFEPLDLPKLNTERWTGPVVDVGMARSGRFGANTAFLIGQKPVYVVKLPGLNDVAELNTPLKPFPVINDTVTRLKRYVLFSKPVIAMVNRLRVSNMDWYTGGFRADMVVDMLKPSSGPTYDEATLYNCVVTHEEIRVTGLHKDDQRSIDSKLVRITNWIAAKHVLLSNYDPDVVFACELWAYRNEKCQPVLCINCESGTYRPSLERAEAFAVYLRTVFGVQVIVHGFDNQEQEIS